MIENIKVPVKDKVICFFHIPKTAGTNFTYLIKNNYKSSSFAINDSKFQAINKKTNKIVCSWGHGGHQMAINSDSIMFVFLRDPVDRVISHFVEHKNNRYIDSDFTLEEMFLKTPDLYLSDNPPTDLSKKRSGIHNNSNWAKNFYCNALYGSGYLNQDIWAPDESIKNSIIKNMSDNSVILLNSEKQNVKIPTIFGITERFEDSIKMFAKVAGWNTTHYEEKSKNRAYNGGKRRYKASEELVKAIREHNALDVDIYEEAKKIFEKELSYFEIG